MSEVLITKIAAVRRKHAAVNAGRGAAAAAGLVVILLAIQMLLDWMLEFPLWLRAVLLAIDVTILAYVVVTYGIRPLLFGPDDDEIALMVERASPDFRTRLIAAVQLSRADALAAGASPALAGALIRETEELARPMDFSQVVQIDRLLRTSALATVALVFGLATFIYGREVAPDLLRRVFLSEVAVPRKTRVESITGDRVIAIGDSITLEAKAGGIVPSSGTIDLEYPSGREQTFTLEASAEDSTRFTRVIENVQETFTYTLRLNDGHSKTHTVRVIPRPAVTGIEITQDYPAYAKRPSEQRPPGDLSLLAGSTLHVKVNASKEIRDGSLRLVGLDQDVRMMVNGPQRDTLSGAFSIPAKGLTGFSVRLVDDHGIASKGETVYPIDVVPDKDPVVRVLLPDRKEELATQSARVLVAFEATDDFGVDRVSVKYRTEEAGPEKYVELDMSPHKETDLRRLRLRHEFDLGAIRPLPLEGSAIEWWLEVYDANNVTGPGKVASDHYRVRIVSEVEKRADLMNRLNDQLTSVDLATQEQEKLNQSLGTLIFEKPAAHTQPSPR